MTNVPAEAQRLSQDTHDCGHCNHMGFFLEFGFFKKLIRIQIGIIVWQW
jgi:hypothetical protein